MAADQTNGNSIMSSQPTCMESVNRISKLPVVESTIQTATSLYEKVKVNIFKAPFCTSSKIKDFFVKWKSSCQAEVNFKRI